MPLDKATTGLGLNKLIASCRKDKRPEYQACLKAVNDLAALADIPLHDHPNDDLDALVGDIKQTLAANAMDVDKTAQAVFERFKSIIDAKVTESLDVLKVHVPEKNDDELYQALLAAITQHAARNGISLHLQSETTLTELFSQIEEYTAEDSEEATILSIFKPLKRTIEKEGIAKKSVENLLLQYPAKQPATEEQKVLLQDVARTAAFYGTPIDSQSETFLVTLFEQLEAYKDDINEHTPKYIFSKLTEIMDKETAEAKREHARHGGYSAVKVHRRTFSSWLEDHDVNALMPKSTERVTVIAPVNRFDAGTHKSTQEAIRIALEHEDITHVLIPIGPGHWRGLYLTKPLYTENKYSLELFDPYGPEGAKSIESFAINVLLKSSIPADKLDITFTGPLKPQRDGYACGDFTCAYSHKKMKAINSAANVHDDEFIDVLDSHGNANDVLRHKTRAIFEAAYPHEKAPSTSFYAGVNSTSAPAPKAISSKNSQALDAYFYLRCLARLAIVAGGIILIASLALSMPPSLAVAGLVSVSIGFFALNHFSENSNRETSTPSLETI
ncbi:MAG: hypothetical protein P1U32_02505 [Legionellaceae bacterium]|nr:hypothetical protein [Legionellaceae bacterium]